MGSRVLGVVWPVLAAVAASTLLVLAADGGLAEWLFGTVMLGLLLVLLRNLWVEHRAATSARSRARELTGTAPEDAARQAVAAERERLSADIDASVTAGLQRVAELVYRARRDTEPVDALRAIQDEARRATAELRLQLTLLNDEPKAAAAPVHQEHPAPVPSLRRRDLAVAGAVGAVAVAEAVGWTALEGLPVTLLSVVLTLCAAVTLVGWRAVPEVAAVACAVVLGLGAVLGHPVQDGMWMALVVGLLVWSLAVAPLTVRAAVAFLSLVVAVVASRLAYQPDNLPVNLVAVAAALVTGLAVGRRRRARARHQAVAECRDEELRQAADSAVQAERRVVARDLHDLVSHAVAVVAIQAAAGEMAWRTDPAATWRALEVVENVTEEALAELGRLRPGFTRAPREWAQVEQLVRRIGAGGLRVDLEVVGPVPSGACLDTTYRVVQEALTNVLRHAPGSAVRATVTTDGDGTTVEVTDDGAGGVAAGRGRGYGLVGLQERVAAAGGELAAGADPHAGGFRVRATLPSGSREPAT